MFESLWFTQVISCRNDTWIGDINLGLHKIFNLSLLVSWEDPRQRTCWEKDLDFFQVLTLPETNIAHENPIFPGKSHQISMAMLVYQSVGTFDHTEKKITIETPFLPNFCLENMFLLCIVPTIIGKLAKKYRHWHLQCYIQLKPCHVLVNSNLCFVCASNFTPLFSGNTSTNCNIGFASCIASGTYSSMTLDLGLFIFKSIWSNLMQQDPTWCKIISMHVCQVGKVYPPKV